MKTKRKIIERLRTYSVRKALKQQKLDYWYRKLEQILPDISDQYSETELDSEYLRTNVRAMHAFQISLFDCLYKKLSKYLYKVTLPVLPQDYKIHYYQEKIQVADYGDSSGNHSLYLKKLYKDWVDLTSYSIDPKAIEKIKSKGLRTVKIPFQDSKEAAWWLFFPEYRVILLFQVLEHLECVFQLLRDFHKSEAEYLIVTVPYLEKSQMGLHHLREGKEESNPEDTHIFELCPEDWKLLFRHSGYEIIKEKIYWQYPRGTFRGLLTFDFWKTLWTWNDYEGFLGLILKREK